MRSSPRIRSPSSSPRLVSMRAVRSPPAMRSVVSMASRIGCGIERVRQVDSSSSATRPNIIPVTICTVVMRGRPPVHLRLLRLHEGLLGAEVAAMSVLDLPAQAGVSVLTSTVMPRAALASVSAAQRAARAPGARSACARSGDRSRCCRGSAGLTVTATTPITTAARTVGSHRRRLRRRSSSSTSDGSCRPGGLERAGFGGRTGDVHSVGPTTRPLPCMEQGRYCGCGLEGGQGANNRWTGLNSALASARCAPSIASLQDPEQESLPCCPG